MRTCHVFLVCLFVLFGHTQSIYTVVLANETIDQNTTKKPTTIYTVNVELPLLDGVTGESIKDGAVMPPHGSVSAPSEPATSSPSISSSALGSTQHAATTESQSISAGAPFTGNGESADSVDGQFLIAARTGQVDAVRDLLEKVTGFGLYEALVEASNNGHDAVVDAILFENPTSEEFVNETLLRASKEKQYLTVKNLLQSTLVNTNSLNLALFSAAHDGRTDVVESILDYQYELCRPGGIVDALNCARKNDHNETAELLYDVFECYNSGIQCPFMENINPDNAIAYYLAAARQNPSLQV